MTRETKIGLLVGLAFIIIVGILLSEPLSHSAEVQPAPLPGVGSNVRSAVATPGATGGTGNPPISMQAQVTPPPMTPQQTVPTQQEVTRQRGGIGVVIGPGAVPSTPQPQAPANDPRREVVAQTRGAGNSSNTPRTLVGPRTGEVTIGTGADVNGAGRAEVSSGGPGIIVPPVNTDNAALDPLTRAAQAVGEELEPVGVAPRVARPAVQGKPAGVTSVKAAQQYQVEAGDSLGKIAAKFYGSSSKPYRDAIANANPSLKADPNRVLAGVTYVIPAIDSAAASAPQQPAPTAVAPPLPTSPTPPTPLPAVARGSPANPAAASVEHWYTVKERDTLWGIAKEQVGDSNAVAALKELNKDALKGGETVRVGMKLRLPAKPVNS